MTRALYGETNVPVEYNTIGGTEVNGTFSRCVGDGIFRFYSLLRYVNLINTLPDSGAKVILSARNASGGSRGFSNTIASYINTAKITLGRDLAMNTYMV